MTLLITEMVKIYDIVWMTANSENLDGVISVIVAPILVLLLIFICRVVLEMMVVLFKIAENTGKK